MEQLITLYLRKLANTPMDFFRYLYDEIDWSNHLIVIKGSKGVGKTTLVMQHIKESFPDPRKALYLSLDHIWFSNHNLLDITEYFYTHGGTHLFLDEVHKYPGWQQEVKNIYDFYPDIHIVVTGSSMLNLARSVKGDLSRRHKMYDLRGLSFREYLRLEGKTDLKAFSLEDILRNHTCLAADITSKIKVLPLFEDYVRHGYYPFYKEEGSGFEERLLQVVDAIITAEIPAVSNIEYSSTYKIKHFLSVLAAENPYTLNIASLCTTLGATRNNLLKLIDLIDSAAIIRKIYLKKGIAGLKKPEKILFDNPNILHAFGNENKGSVRESFMASQLSEGHSLYMPTRGDFLVDDKFTIEVGGAAKTFDQISDMPDSFVAADDIEIGAGAKIPLWMFGLLY